MCNKIIYLGLVLVLSFTGFVKGSCLEYGHSCWGAHGKRSGGKIYRSIDGNESQQSDGNRDIPLTQDKVKPSELLNILLDRKGRLSIDEARNPHDLSMTNNENENIFAGPEPRLRRKLKDAFRKGGIFHFASNINDFPGLRGSTEASAAAAGRNQIPSAGSSNDYYQVENYPSINLEMEYLDLK